MRTISQIANEIHLDWKNVNYAARPYLDAMFSLETVKDYYGFDSGDSIIMYFLCNAQTWRGGKAREIKAELNKLIKR
jgi:hypothetical protein